MRYLFSAMVLSAAICAVDAQQINLTGKVIDTASLGLADASVSMPTHKLSTLSGLDGSFSLTGSAGVFYRAPLFRAPGPLMTGNCISVALDKEQTVTIAAFDPRGRRTWKTALHLGAGSHVIPVFPENSSAQTAIINLQTGGKAYLFKVCAIAARGRGRVLSPQSINETGARDARDASGARTPLAKTAAAVDSLDVALAGYVPVVLPLDSLTGSTTITLHRLPLPVSSDRLTLWNPGILIDKQRGLPLRADKLPDRTAIYATLSPGGNIQTALNNCPAGQVVLLNPGTYAISSTLLISKGVVLRGSGSQGGPAGTTIVKTGGQSVLQIGQARDQTCYGGTAWNLVADGAKESRTISVGPAASNFSAGDLALIDAVDDNVIQQGDGTYFKRVSGRSASQRVEIAAVDAANGRLTLGAPLHWNFKAASPYLAQIVRVTNTITRWAGIESLRIQGGTNPGYDGQMAGGIDISDAACCWVKDVQTDSTISGMHVCLTATFRCVVRDCYFHNSGNYGFGTDCYGIVLRCGAAENLIENNISRYMNKPVLFNVSGGGNVVGYNYADNSWATPPAWQEVNIDCHCSFPHMELIEGNEAPHAGASTTHGNAGYLTFFRNFSSSLFASPPVYGSTAAQTGNVASMEFDAGDVGMTVIGCILGATGVSAAYDAYSSGPKSIYELGGAGDVSATSLVRQGNYDYVNKAVMWYPATAACSLPASIYLTARPAWWPSGQGWPWAGPDCNPMAGVLPAKARALAMP